MRQAPLRLLLTRSRRMDGPGAIRTRGAGGGWSRGPGGWAPGNVCTDGGHPPGRGPDGRGKENEEAPTHTHSPGGDPHPHPQARLQIHPLFSQKPQELGSVLGPFLSDHGLCSPAGDPGSHVSLPPAPALGGTGLEPFPPDSCRLLFKNTNTNTNTKPE